MIDKEQILEWVGDAERYCSLSDIVEKHRALGTVLAEIRNTLGEVLDTYVNDVLARADAWEMRPAGYGDALAASKPSAATVAAFLTRHAADVERWEQEDDTAVAARLEKLKQYDAAPPRVDMQEIAEGLVAAGYGEVRGDDPTPLDEDRIYYSNGAWRKWWRWREMFRQEAALLFVSITNEVAAVEREAKARGVSLTVADNAAGTPSAALSAAAGTSSHDDDENATARKVERFMEYIHADKRAYARKLLARLIKNGYCDSTYHWNAAKWEKGKSRLALACLAYAASRHMAMSERKRWAGDGTPYSRGNADGKQYTVWQPFEILFTYDGKKEGKDGKYHQLQDTATQYERYSIEGALSECPEMREIERRVLQLETPSKH